MKKNKKILIIGILAGLVCGFFTSSGGLILVPAFIYIFKLSDVKARATSIISILPMVAVSGIVYIQSGLIDWNLGIKVAIGGVIGGIIGSKLLLIIPKKYLKASFIIFVLYAGIKMIL